MTAIPYRGSWQLRVVRKDSDWPQRVVISGSVVGTIRGEVGASALLAGDLWYVTIEHDFGRGWQASRYVANGPLRWANGHATQLVVSKDRYWPGDVDPNDLVLSLTNLGSEFEVVGEPYAVDESLRTVLPGVGGSRARYLAVDIRNTSFEAYGYDVTLDITDAGRRALANQGVLVQESWSPVALRLTRQEVFESGVSVPPLEVGDVATIFFQIDATHSSVGQADVEFRIAHAQERKPQTPRRRRVIQAVSVTDNRASASEPLAVPEIGAVVVSSADVAGAGPTVPALGSVLRGEPAPARRAESETVAMIDRPRVATEGNPP